ncbi:cupredoxin domain-containing protein [Kaistia adipata]|uniref:cupredoxin domain-containing protein n=1 Tax=Kaistia adipata TaxID=166954 RepID=UPI00041BDA00|nr:cupredoxin family copper-binding protein [Kaistia adipata]
MAALAGVVLLPAMAAAETITVQVTKFSFVPASVTAKVGDTIEWVNADFVDHTATAANKGFDVKLPANKSGSVTVKKAGTFPYFCRFHPMMKGTITVKK